MRVALVVEYDGSAFHGWERQRDRRTVQGTLEGALSRIAARPVTTTCAGRTDAGVHATGQVVHLDPGVERPLRAWTRGVTAALAPDASVLWAGAVDHGFHARFSALDRTYRYLILDRPARPAIWRDRVAWSRRALDARRMHAAAQALVGSHDFSAYRAAGCQAHSPVRTLHRIEIRRRGGLVEMELTANAFLQHMVRNVAGVLMAIGAGRAGCEWAGEVLATRDRTRGGVTAPPGGLYLVGVRYPEAFDLPAVGQWRSLW